MQPTRGISRYLIFLFEPGGTADPIGRVALTTGGYWEATGRHAEWLGQRHATRRSAVADVVATWKARSDA